MLRCALSLGLVLLSITHPSLSQYGPPSKGGKKPITHHTPSPSTPALLASPEQLGVSYTHGSTVKSGDYNSNPFLNGGISLQNNPSSVNRGDNQVAPAHIPAHVPVQVSGCSGAACGGEPKKDYSQNPFLSGQVHTDNANAQTVSQGSYGSVSSNKPHSPVISSYPPAPQKPKPFYPDEPSPTQTFNPTPNHPPPPPPPQHNGPVSVPCDPGTICVASNVCNNGFVNQNHVRAAKPEGAPCSPEEGLVCCSTTDRQGPNFVQQQVLSPQTPSLVQVRPNQPSPGFVQQGNLNQNFNQIRVTQRPAVTFRPQAPYTGPLNTTPHPGCAAALKCVPLEYCTWEGVMSEQPVILSRQEDESRVPLTECSNPETGIIGKCCRDPNYKDPWPDMLPGGGCYEGTACEPMETCDNDRMAQPKATCNLVQQGGVGICCIQRRKVGSTPLASQQRPIQQTYPQRPPVQSYPSPTPQPTYPQPPVQQTYPRPPQTASYPSVPQDQHNEGSHISTGVNQVVAPPPVHKPVQTTIVHQQRPATFVQNPTPQPAFVQRPVTQHQNTFVQTETFVQKPNPQPAFVQQQQHETFVQKPNPQPTFVQQQQHETFVQQPNPQPAFVQQQQQHETFVQEKVDSPPNFAHQEVTSQQQIQGGFVSQSHQTVSNPGQGTQSFTQTSSTFTQEQPAHTSFFQQQSPGATAQPVSGYPQQQQQQQHGEASAPHIALIPPQYPQLSEQAEPGRVCGVRRVTESSGLNGQDGQTVPGEFPWLALITLPANRSRLCAGALISDSAVLTSAHCVLGLTASDLQVEVGSWLPYDRNHPEKQQINVAAVARHPHFEEGSLSSDMAVLLLVHPAVLGRNVDLVCLPEPGQVDDIGGLRRPGGACLMTSWPKNGGNDGFLHRLAMKAVPKAECEKSLRQTYLGKYFQLNRSFVCALPVNSQRDVCSVGLGGPLVCPLEDGRYVVTAASSWDVGCQERAAPSVLCAVDITWVNEVLARPVQDFIQAPADQRVDFVVDSSTASKKPGFSQGYGRR